MRGTHRIRRWACPSGLLVLGAAALLDVGLLGAGPVVAQSPALSPFQRAKVERLIRERLACLGCHRLDGVGGMIGPDLSAVGARRTADFIRRMISDPQATLPGTIMPRTPMPEAWRELLVRYLAERRGAAGAPTDAAARSDPVARRPANPPAPLMGGALYARYCAACHGAKGEGDGPNARYLPVKPTVHADSAYLSHRPDDTLFDGIYGGGHILNRSNLMPAFGATLTREQIWSLVGYLRELCRCQGPSWSRDGRR